MREVPHNGEVEAATEPTWWIMLDVMADDGSLRCVRESFSAFGQDEAVRMARGRVADLQDSGVTVTGWLVSPDGLRLEAPSA
jgi:hypothetical protein